MALACSEQAPVNPAAVVVPGRQPEIGAGDEVPVGSSLAIGRFREGPGLVAVTTPAVRFLWRWWPRPLSQWRGELNGRAWPIWQADLLIRAVTLLWFLAGGLVLSLVTVGMIAVVGKLIVVMR